MNEFDMNSVLTPSDILIISLSEYMYDMSYLHVMIGDQFGIYIKGQNKPIFLFKDPVYPKNKAGIETSRIDSMDKFMNNIESLVDKTGQVIVEKSKLSVMKKLVLEQPILPTSYIQCAKIIVENNLFNLCPIKKGRRGYKSLKPYIHEEHYTSELEDFIERDFERLLSLIHRFVKNDVWHIYFIKLSGDSLIIEKNIDYRVYWWYESEYPSS